MSLKPRANKSGSALILTMFIMLGMLIIAMSGAYIAWLGIKAGGIQAQSTKAYYAAEAGAERLLFELRRNYYDYPAPSGNILFSSPVPTACVAPCASYKVYFAYLWPLVFQSVGEYQNTKRSVEIRIGD